MDINGIGTAATRSGLITELTKPKGSNKQLYAEKRKNCFYSTELGRSIIDVVPKYMSDLDFLAAMDKKIKSVAEGEASRDDVLRQLEKELEENLELMKIGTGKNILISKKPAQKESSYKCPICGLVLYEYDKGYGCSGYLDKACSFFLHRTKGGKKITQAQISKLLKNGKTDTIKGFKSRAGKSFDTQLVLTEEGKVIYAFQDK